MDITLEEGILDVFEEDDGQLFTIYNNELNYIYLDYDFYKLFKNDGIEYDSVALLESELKDGKFILSDKYLKCLNESNHSLYEFINNRKKLALKLLNNTDRSILHYLNINKYIEMEKHKK